MHILILFGIEFNLYR